MRVLQGTEVGDPLIPFFIGKWVCFCEIRRKFDDSLTAYLKYYSTNVSRCFIYQAHRTSCKPEEHMESQFNMDWLNLYCLGTNKKVLSMLIHLIECT